ncbi:DUF1275 family protein [Microbacterium oleivorans]|uniref:DUF1275 domain-containing protein n=1 Tax=Microbacterium oleivorans TaxID=273677 RepID=A0A7D5F825_9MICO|nr:YoaK family protein [Microbacterium oleivorans]QLD12473.1 DUF1275 domain-containing protein [Microbacterium oleivorans]
MLNTLRSQQPSVHLGLMLLLTFSTGIIDAVGYLGLDRVFTGNMTGNVVILGMALTGADDLPVLGPVVALAGFMLGAATAGRVLKPVKVGWTHRTTALIAVVGSTMAAIAGVVTAVTPSEPLALAVTTVVVTSTITGFAADSWIGNRSGQPWFRRLAAIVLIGAGAAVGALALQVGLGLGLAVAAVITIATAGFGHLTGHVKHAAP